MPKKKKGSKKGSKKKKKGSGKKKKSSSAGAKAKREAAPPPPPPPGPNEEHDASCACEYCRRRRAMVQIEFKVVTENGLDHPSNFDEAVPSWTGVWDLYTLVAKEFYQIPSDLALYRSPEDAAGETHIPLDLTLGDLGIHGPGDAADSEPTRATLWVVSKHSRFGYADPLSGGQGIY